MEAVCDNAQRFFSAVGLRTPTLRFIGGFTAVALLLNFAKPSMMFTEIGTARPWTLSVADDSKLQATMFPWWLAAMSVGAFVGLCA